MNKGLTALTTTAFIDMLGFAIVFPLLPFFARELGASPFMIGIMISSFSIAQLAMSPIWGRVSDHYGRRPVLLVALVASGVAFVVFGLASTVWLLLLSRLVQGAGGGTTGVVQAYVADSTTPQDRVKALGWLSSATSAGVACGGAIGAVAVRFGHATPGYIAAALCFGNVIFAWRVLPESRPRIGAPKRSIRSSAWHVLRHPFAPQPRLIWIYAVGMGAFAAMSSCVALYLGDRFGVTERTIGYVFGYLTLLAIVMRAVILGRLVDRIGETREMRAGALVFAVGLALYTLPATIPVFAVVLPLIPIGQALLFPAVTALSSHRSDPKEQGQMMGVQQAFGGAARVIGPIWAGAAYQGLGPSSPFLIAALIMAVVGVLAFQVPLAPVTAAAAAAD